MPVFIVQNKGIFRTLNERDLKSLFQEKQTAPNN